MIGIIGAMPEEIDGLLGAFDSEAKVTAVFGSTFYSGSINGKDIVVAKSGIGKVNAAFVATLLGTRFGASKIVMTGIAGGIKCNTLDAVVATGFVHHDVSMVDEEDGHLDILDTIVIPADEELSKIISDEKSVRGIIATGEAFIADKRLGDYIVRRFPGVVAVDMECGAVAQVCTRMGVPFAAIKVISDGCDGEVYLDLAVRAAEMGVAAVLKLFT